MGTPLVGIVMGSASDYETLAKAEGILFEFDVPYEISVVSAHRMPEEMYDYARSAAGRGLKVLIAGAGGAAHLPGMVSALTTLFAFLYNLSVGLTGGLEVTLSEDA